LTFIAVTHVCTFVCDDPVAVKKQLMSVSRLSPGDEDYSISEE